MRVAQKRDAVKEFRIQEDDFIRAVRVSRSIVVGEKKKKKIISIQGMFRCVTQDGFHITAIDTQYFRACVRTDNGSDISKK